MASFYKCPYCGTETWEDNVNEFTFIICDKCGEFVRKFEPENSEGENNDLDNID